MKTKKKSGKTLRKSGKSQGKIREFDGIKKVGILLIMHPSNTVYLTLGKWVIVAKEHVYSYSSSCASFCVFVSKYNFCG